MFLTSKYFSLVVLLLTCLGCQQPITETPEENTNYFPLEVGDYWDYQVTQTTYVSTRSVVISQFQVRQRISSSYGQNGQTFFVIEESTRKTGQTAWQLTTIRTVYKNLSEVVSLENNVPVVRMVFPLNETTTWNANRYNAYPDTILHYKAISRPVVIDTAVFPRTVEVMSDNDSTLISRQKHTRTYAYQIGLVYREDVSLAYCQSTSDCLGKALIDHGTQQSWQLIASNQK